MIAFLTILYNAEYNALDNIHLAKKHGFTPIVYLNKVDPALLEKLTALEVVILGSNVNVGIGTALYEMEEYLIYNGFTHAIYFDQDTIVSSEAFSAIKGTYIDAFSSKQVGLVYYTSEDPGKYNPSIVINSGTMFSVDIIKSVGLHDRTYFVEGCDYEYCIRVRKSNRIIHFCKIDGIDHFSLQDGVKKSILGFVIQLRVYGSARTKDFNKSQFKLLAQSIKYNFYDMSLFFLKSLVMFNIMEFVSRVLVRKEH